MIQIMATTFPHQPQLNKPTHFFKIISDHSLNEGKLNVPTKFGEKHLDLGKNRGDIQLQVLNGRLWPARYLTRIRCKKSRFELLDGWKAFAKDNNLKEGDVCIFELIDETKLNFMVHIFRESENSNCSTSQEYSDKASTSQGQGKEMKIITTTKSSPPPKSFNAVV